jgi:UDP-N-acetyl-D-galactosamine dehydrogenase
MGAYVADQLIKKMICKGTSLIEAEVLVLGFTFKENCPDVRNTRVIDIVRRLEEYKVKVHIHDPWANADQAKHTYGIICENGESKERTYDGILLAVAHEEFKDMDLKALCKPNAVLYDLKAFLPDNIVNARL